MSARYKLTDLPERIRSKVTVSASGCWEWPVGSVTQYGNIHVDGKCRKAHRVIYEMLVQPIPAGMQIDHLCRVRKCCNPAHLEVVTPSENVLRGVAYRGRYA